MSSLNMIEELILHSFIFFGLAHFLVTFIHIYKVGKFTREYSKKFIFLLIPLFIFSFISFHNSAIYPYLIFFTLIIFVAHYVLDEFKITNFLESKKTFLAIIISSFSALLLNKLFDLYFSSILFASISIIFLFYYIYRKKIVISKNYYISAFIFLNTFLPLVFIFTNVSIILISGFIIFFHYIRWYIFYFLIYFKSKDWVKMHSYLNTVISAHLIILILYILYLQTNFQSIFIYFFHPAYFYMWTNLHILLSIRKSDFEN